MEDDLPDLKSLRYKEKHGCYFAELDGYVNFMYYSGPGQGYGGRHFDITMEDGTQKTLIGPWSSRAGAMNATGFIPCVDVCIDINNSRFSSAVTLDFIKQNIDKIDFGTTFRFKKEMHEIVFPPGSKLTMTPCSNSSGDVVYQPTVEFPDGTRFEKDEFIAKEWPLFVKSLSKGR